MNIPKTWKEWEKPVQEIEELLAQMREKNKREPDPERREENEARIDELVQRRDIYLANRYAKLGPWENVLLARAEPRPYTSDYIHAIFRDFTELEGDRRFGPDPAIVGGPATFDGRPVMVIGHQKGRTIQERTHRNFAMAKPEGYRKAMRLMDLAERLRMPVITLVDTPAADPGVEAESRGISEAIAASMLCMFDLTVPVVSAVIGEGGSGGAIGIAVANKVLMLEHAIYSVIPPEGCAAILWRQPEKGPQAAAALRLTAASALEYGIVDVVLPEPLGGAHRDPIAMADTLAGALREALEGLVGMSGEELRTHRAAKFRQIGRFERQAAAAR